jgi:hypothetical protein
MERQEEETFGFRQVMSAGAAAKYSSMSVIPPRVPDRPVSGFRVFRDLWGFHLQLISGATILRSILSRGFLVTGRRQEIPDRTFLCAQHVVHLRSSIDGFHLPSRLALDLSVEEYFLSILGPVVGDDCLQSSPWAANLSNRAHDVDLNSRFAKHLGCFAQWRLLSSTQASPVKGRSFLLLRRLRPT